MFGLTANVPVGGLAGWRYLQRTETTQLELISKSPRVSRDLEYFDANIAKATTAEALVEDPTLLRVALTAFGLEDQQQNKAFLLKVLEEGTIAEDAFANRLSDKRFHDFAEAFSYGNVFGPPLVADFFKEDIRADFLRQSFEIAVGEQDENLRLALNFVRNIQEIAQDPAVEQAGWFGVMGQAPIRQVVEKAFGLPAQTVGLDLDRQRELFEAKSSSVLGQSDAGVFLDPEKVDEVVRRFLLRSQIESGDLGYSSGATALSILQASGLGGGASFGLVQSFF